MTKISRAFLNKSLSWSWAGALVASAGFVSCEVAFGFSWSFVAATAALLALLCGNLCLVARRAVRLEAELADLRLKSTKAIRLAAIGEMAGAVAHEINNPLTVIYGTVQQMLKMHQLGLLQDDKFEKFSGRILQTTTRIASIVRGLRNLSRQTDEDPLELTPLDEIVSDTVALSSLRIAPRRIDVVVSQMDPNLLVKCRPVQIAQVLLNLLNNAFDATSEVEVPRVELVALCEQGVVEIRVEDNGAGIAPEVASKVMQPFFTTKGSGKGTGLGLSVSANIMKAHNGSLSFESAPGRTTFTMRLPVHPEAQRTAA